APGDEGAPAPQQPTRVASGAPAAGGMSSLYDEGTGPFKSAGQQIADALYPAPGTPGGPGGEYRGVPRRIWEFVKGSGNAVMVPATVAGNLFGHALATADDTTGALTDATLDKRIAEAHDLERAGNTADQRMYYERLR